MAQQACQVAARHDEYRQCREVHEHGNPECREERLLARLVTPRALRDPGPRLLTGFED